MTANGDSDRKSPDPPSNRECPFRGVVHLPPGDRSLAGTMQEGADFMFAKLAGVDLTEANFYWASFHNAVLERAIMAGCDLRGAVFNEANLRCADLSRANAGIDNLGGSTDFIKADLSGADLRNANLSGTDFTCAILIGADLSGARASISQHGRPTCFKGANLTDARLGGARFVGAVYDESTKFPRGFKPEVAGMVTTLPRKPRKTDSAS
jgi:uncharacterized protein YjbI with pentapeptide repeats